MEIQNDLRLIYAPDGSLLRQAQQELLDLLKCFDKLCSDNGIQYFLDGGTLLGAVRHNGFIPWDDDIDILLFPRDYKKLKKVCGEELKYPLVLHTLEDDFNYPFVYPKFRNEENESGSSNPQRAKNYKYKGVGIDIFHTQQTNTWVARICNGIYYKIVPSKAHKISNAKLRFIYTRFFQILLLRILFPILNAPIRLFGNRNEYHFALGTPWTRRKMFRDKFFPAKMCKFEDEEFPIPNDSDLYLKMAYGDYMKLPSQEQILSTIHNAEYREEIMKRLSK